MWWQRQRLFPSVSRVRYLNAVCSVSGCRWSPSVLVLYLLFVGLHGEIWYQKPWINFKSFYCFTCLVRHTKYRSFPYREPMWKEAKYSCTKQKEPGFLPNFNVTVVLSPLWERWWNIQSASWEAQQFSSYHLCSKVIQLEMDSIFLLERRSKAFIYDAKHHIHLCAAGCLQQASWMHCLDWGFFSTGSMPCTYFYKIIFQNLIQSCSEVHLCHPATVQGTWKWRTALGLLSVGELIYHWELLQDCACNAQRPGCVLIFLSHIKIFIYVCSSK